MLKKWLEIAPGSLPRRAVAKKEPAAAGEAWLPGLRWRRGPLFQHTRSRVSAMDSKPPSMPQHRRLRFVPIPPLVTSGTPTANA